MNFFKYFLTVVVCFGLAFSVTAHPKLSKFYKKPEKHFDYVQINTDMGIKFSQMSYEYTGVQYRETDFGMLRVNPARIHSGYLNMLLCPKNTENLGLEGCYWSVRNVFVPNTRLTNTAKFDRKRLRKLFKQAINEPAYLRGQLSLWQLFKSELPQQFNLSYPFDLFPQSTIAERELRIRQANDSTEIDSVVSELQGIVVLCAEMMPNRQTFDRVIASKEFSIVNFNVEQSFENAEGAEGEKVIARSSQTQPERDTQPSIRLGYLGVIGFPPYASPALEPLPDPIPNPSDDIIVMPTQFYQDASFNIHAAKNQCAEAADANAYRFLDSTTGHWSMQFAFMPGYAKDPDLDDYDEQNEVYTNKSNYVIYGPIHALNGADCGNCTVTGVLDAFARREDVISANTAPSGTTRCEHYRALFGYLTNLGAVADYTKFRHAGSSNIYGDNANCDDNDYPWVIRPGQRSLALPFPNGPTVSGKSTVTWQWVYDRLEEQRALVCTIGRYDVMDPDSRKRTSGHLVRVYGARQIVANNFKQDWIYTMDDEFQGSSTNTLRTSVWELKDLNGDSRLNVNGANTELEYCIAIEAIPVPPNLPF